MNTAPSVRRCCLVCEPLAAPRGRAHLGADAEVDGEGRRILLRTAEAPIPLRPNLSLHQEDAHENDSQCPTSHHPVTVQWWPCHSSKNGALCRECGAKERHHADEGMECKQGRRQVPLTFSPPPLYSSSQHPTRSCSARCESGGRRKVGRPANKCSNEVQWAVQKNSPPSRINANVARGGEQEQWALEPAVASLESTTQPNAPAGAESGSGAQYIE